jgi:ATP-dependent helicase/nuclease subunit B
VKFLGQDRIDPDRRLAEALAAIGRCRSLPQADVFVDSFYDFTGSERKVIAALGKVCKSTSITLTLDPASPCIANFHHVPDEMSLFHRGERAYRKLWFTLQEEGVEVLEPALLKEPRRFKSKRLAALEDAFSGSPQVSAAQAAASAKDRAAPGNPAIQLIEAPDFQAEVDAVARWIRLLVTGPMRYRDIVVLMRSQQDYQHLLDVSFREHNIPFFVDRRRSASHHPLLRLIRAALAVANGERSHEAMIAVIKTGLVGLTDSDADALENYALLHGIDHETWISPQPWTGRRSRREESDQAWVDEAPRMDALRRRVVDPLWRFVQSTAGGERTSVASLASAVFRLLEDFHCRDQIVQWMDRAMAAGELEERGEHERVWDELVELFDELVDLFGDEAIGLKDFSAVLDSALEGFDLALTPPTVDQVLVGVVDRTRVPAVKACAVLGLAEGQFPRVSLEESIYTDADRRALGRNEIDLDPDSSRRLLDEQFLGYLALSRASERLLLTRTASDEAGRPVEASPLWRRVVEIVPDAPLAQLPHEEMLPLRHVATPRQLVGSLGAGLPMAGAASAVR